VGMNGGTFITVVLVIGVWGFIRACIGDQPHRETWRVRDTYRNVMMLQFVLMVVACFKAFAYWKELSVLIHINP